MLSATLRSEMRNEVDRLVDSADASELRGGRAVEPHWRAVKQDLAGGLSRNGGIVCRWRRWLVHKASGHQHHHHPLRRSATRHPRLRCRLTAADAARRYDGLAR